MKVRQPVIFYATDRTFPYAKEVQYCTEPVNGLRCGCPVPLADGAMEAHKMRVHSNARPAAPIHGVVKWERKWRR